MARIAFVSYPTAKFTEDLVKRTLLSAYPHIRIVDALATDGAPPADTKILQWAAYDETNHALTLEYASKVLASSYTIRKSLIRKHFLHRWVTAYLAKHADSSLAVSVPKTWDFELTWADELDEMWSDDLYDLGQLLEAEDDKWFILKPGMADRGMGIRLFNSKEGLQEIFDTFEAAEGDGDEAEDEVENDTVIFASQLRHFVAQEYVDNPLLIDPRQVAISADATPPAELEGRKFHLRVYCVAYGALTVFVAEHILALFASEAYSPPSDDTLDNLAPHLTNTCLQKDAGEENVRLLSELVGCQYKGAVFGDADLDDIQDQVADVLAETFRAALESPIHFQPLPNAFELFGADLLVTHEGTPQSARKFRVKLLELNAEPAIEMTAPRLQWILDELFTGTLRACVAPFWDGGTEPGLWPVGETRHGLRKCLEAAVRGQGAW